MSHHTVVAWYYGIMLSVCVSVSLSYARLSVILFPDNKLSKCQWIFTKLCVCIDIVEIWFGIVNGHISSIFDRVICLRQAHISFSDDNFCKYQWIFAKLGVCIDIVYFYFGIADGQILSIFESIIYYQYFTFRTIT